MVKKPPSNAGDEVSILGQGTKITCFVRQLSPRATAKILHATAKT